LIFCSFFFSSRRRHTSFSRDWSSDVCSSDLPRPRGPQRVVGRRRRGGGAVAARLRGVGPAVGVPRGRGDRRLPVVLARGQVPQRSEERRVGKESRITWVEVTWRKQNREPE